MQLQRAMAKEAEAARDARAKVEQPQIAADCKAQFLFSDFVPVGRQFQTGCLPIRLLFSSQRVAR